MEEFLDITLILEIQILCTMYAVWEIYKHLNRKDKK